MSCPVAADKANAAGPDLAHPTSSWDGSQGCQRAQAHSWSGDRKMTPYMVTTNKDTHHARKEFRQSVRAMHCPRVHAPPLSFRRNPLYARRDKKTKDTRFDRHAPRMVDARRVGWRALSETHLGNRTRRETKGRAHGPRLLNGCAHLHVGQIDQLIEYIAPVIDRLQTSSNSMMGGDKTRTNNQKCPDTLEPATWTVKRGASTT